VGKPGRRSDRKRNGDGGGLTAACRGRPAGCRLLLWAGLWPWVGGQLAGQPIRVNVYSEFQRVDPFGNIVAADRAERPREILSPAVARRGYASFQVAVTVPENTPFTLYFGQNPEGVLDLTLYKERYTRCGDGWVPDGLERVLEPYKSAAQPASRPIPGQTTTAFWLDVRAPGEARVGRMRLEAQLNVGEHWVIYPMEIRVLRARIPKFTAASEALPPVEAPADGAAAGPLRAYLCGPGASNAAAPLTARRLIRRNAQQDMALARLIETKTGKDVLAARLAAAAGAADPRAWCEQPSPPRSLGAEWYLRVRDYLYRAAQ